MAVGLIHDVTIERRLFDDSPSARDDYGQPTESTSTSNAKGLVQPRRAEEADDFRSSGTEVADYVVFLPIGTDLDNATAILYDGKRYEVAGIRPFPFGRLPHLEVDARLTTAQAVAGDGEAS